MHTVLHKVLLQDAAGCIQCCCRMLQAACSAIGSLQDPVYRCRWHIVKQKGHRALFTATGGTQCKRKVTGPWLLLQAEHRKLIISFAYYCKQSTHFLYCNKLTLRLVLFTTAGRAHTFFTATSSFFNWLYALMQAEHTFSLLRQAHYSIDFYLITQAVHTLFCYNKLTFLLAFTY